MVGSLLIKWTIRLSLICYAVYLGGWLYAPNRRWPATSRLIWTFGCVLFDVHVLCAFHFRHHWSHAAAWRHTAERTHEMLGFAFGDGIFFSYLFLALWTADVLWLWARPPVLTEPPASFTSGSSTNPVQAGASPMPPSQHLMPQTPVWRILVHLFLLFIAINGAVVFEAGPTRLVGIPALLTLAGLAGCRVYNRHVFTKTKCPLPEVRYPAEV